MGCNQTPSLEENEGKNSEDKKRGDKKDKKRKNSEENENEEKDEEKNNSNINDKETIEKKENKNKKNKKSEKKSNEKNGDKILNTEENKELSNIMTEGITSENRKLNLQRQNYEGVVLMKGVEESIPEDLNEDDLYQLVEDALYDKIVEDKDKDKEEGKITKKQVKAIAAILYNKLNKEEGKKGSKKNDSVNLKDYPELKGMKIKIGVGQLTKDIIKNVMFHDKKVDDCQIDLTYANLTKENNDIKALTIEIE